MKKIKITLTNSQYRFLLLDCRHPLFVGGPGSGKSFIMDYIAVQYGMHSKEAEIYLYAPENHHIRRIHVPGILYWLDQLSIKHKNYNRHDNSIESEDDRCGSFFFRNFDDPNSYVGYQSYLALVDELDTQDENKASLIWSQIIERNRQQPKGVPEEYKYFDEKKGKKFAKNRTMAFTTPEGYNFCYKTWELRDHPEYKQVKGHTRENPILDSAYEESVRDRMPKHIADKYLAGEFVNMASLSVYHAYDPDKHDSFETIQPKEPLYIGCDFNVDNTAATVFVKRNKKEWHAVAEFSGVRDAATLADMIDKQYKQKGHDITMYPDCSGKSRNNANTASLTAIQELKSKGFRIKAKGKNFPVEDRVNSTNKALNEMLMFVNQRECPNTSRCLINQANDKYGKPDKRSGYDHQNDATTYPIVYELGPRANLFKINLKFVTKQ